MSYWGLVRAFETDNRYLRVKKLREWLKHHSNNSLYAHHARRRLRLDEAELNPPVSRQESKRHLFEYDLGLEII